MSGTGLEKELMLIMRDDPMGVDMPPLGGPGVGGMLRAYMELPYGVIPGVVPSGVLGKLGAAAGRLWLTCICEFPFDGTIVVRAPGSLGGGFVMSLPLPAFLDPLRCSIDACIMGLWGLGATMPRSADDPRISGAG
jgi:hypothetical protein